MKSISFLVILLVSFSIDGAWLQHKALFKVLGHHQRKIATICHKGLPMLEGSQEDNKVAIGSTYRHYKGKLYQVTGVGLYSEDPLQKFVIYKALYNCPTFGKDATWVRPLSMFIEEVEIDGVLQQRFKKIS